MIDRLT